MPNHQDPATAPDRALDAFIHALDIDSSRTVRDAPNGFTWWVAPGLRQHVRVETGPPSGTPWLRIVTPVWRGADARAIAPLIEVLRRHARGAAVRHEPDSGDVALITRAPLPGPQLEDRAAAIAGTGAIQAYLAAWAWGEARSQLGARASAWRDDLLHPELGMGVAPDRVLGYRKRFLAPRAEARLGTFAETLVAATADAIEHTGLGRKPQRDPSGRSVAFAVDLNVTLGHLEVAVIRGAADAHALGVALSVQALLTEAQADACSHELLTRQLAPGADAWTLASWMPLPRRKGRPGFGLTHGMFLPLALAEPDAGPEIADAVARTVELIRAWFDEGAPVPVAAPRPHAGVQVGLVA